MTIVEKFLVEVLSSEEMELLCAVFQWCRLGLEHSDEVSGFFESDEAKKVYQSKVVSLSNKLVEDYTDMMYDKYKA